MLEQIVNEIKNNVASFYNLLYVLGAYLGIKHEMMGILATLLIIDTVTGILKSARINGVKSITSTSLTAGIISKMLLFLVPVIVALALKSFNVADSTVVLQASIGVLCMSEAYSSISNIQSYRTGEAVDEVDALAIILKWMKKLLLTLINKLDRLGD